MRLISASCLAAFMAAVPAGASAQDSLGLRPGIVPGDGAVLEEAAPIPRRTVSSETDPYEALGIRAGGFILYPSLTVRGGYTTNADAAAGGSGAGFGVLTPELLLRPDWARHQATLRLSGDYTQYFDGSAASPSASAEATGRIDIADGWTGDLAASYDYGQQSITDPNYPASADFAPGVHDLAASAGLSGHAGGRGVFAVEGKLARSIYENASSGGGPIDQGDRNNTVFGARLRAGYEVTASLTPFVEGEVSRRLYDRPLDSDSIARSSANLAWRAGVAVDRGPLLSGEIAVGVAEETFDDASLAALRALTVDGSLVWAPTALTTVTFNGSTALDPSTDPTSSGSVVYDGSVDLAYAWRRNATLTGTAGVRQERFQGTNLIDTRYRAGFGATWKLNRTMHLTAGYLHEWLQSSDASRDYQSDEVRLELRLQR
ncbi:MAG: outer membrane beta-barrel protein [Bauldia sp.]|nr:outer membrane beta-barrel protein [Bauldia sp.]